MTQWTAFVGVTGLVLSLFLALARLSQGAVRDGPAGDVSDGDAQFSATTDSRGDGSPPVRTANSSPADAGPGFRSGSTDRAGREGDGAAVERGSDGGGDPSPPIAATAPIERDRVGLDISPGMLLVNVALTQGVFGAAVAGAAVYFAVPVPALGLSGAGLSTGLPAVGVGIGFGVVLWIGNELASVLAESAGVAYDERLRGMLAPDSAGGWVLLLGGALPLVAAVEELLFRAAAVGVPAAAYGTSPWALAVVSSVAFALGHGAQGRTGMVVTGGLGFALAAGFVLTNSLLVVVIAHYLVNALEFVAHEGLGVERPLV